jgi:hypothetical protein
MEQQDGQEEVLYTLEKSETDQVRIRKTNFKTKDYIDIRIFTKNQAGEYIPTKKGVTLNIEKMKELRDALKDLQF